SVVIVNWNVRDLLRTTLTTLQAELAAEPAVAAEVIVVDNDSHDGSADMVRTEFSDVRLIANDYNAGFSAGNNQGIDIAQGEYVLFLNPDTEVRPGGVRRLL